MPRAAAALWHSAAVVMRVVQLPVLTRTDVGGGPATEKVVVTGPEPDGIVNVWPKAVSVLPLQPSPHESVISSEHEAVAGADTEPENGAPPDAMNEPPHVSDQLTSYG